jgi:hypothetical protein
VVLGVGLRAAGVVWGLGSKATALGQLLVGKPLGLRGTELAKKQLMCWLTVDGVEAAALT